MWHQSASVEIGSLSATFFSNIKLRITSKVPKIISCLILVKISKYDRNTLFFTISRLNILYFECGDLSPVHIREPINPRSLPLWKNGRIRNERALIAESVCLSKIQRELVGPALRGRGERNKFFNRLKNGWG